jgi:hypothetical protein
MRHGWKRRTDFWDLSVLVGVIVALIPTENCERFSCSNSYDSIGVGLGLAVSGGFTRVHCFHAVEVHRCQGIGDSCSLGQLPGLI